jgi:hypothetical protein
MAIFNPQLAPASLSNLPSYKQVEGVVDQSKAMLINTGTQALDSAVKITDETIKRKIDSEVYTSVDKQRDEFTQGLEQIKAQTQSNSVVPPPVQSASGSTTGKSWLDANASMDRDPTLDTIDGSTGLSQIDTLRQAQKAAKINDTQYSGEVLQIAKNLRSTYGVGYREYIDQKISQASGLPVANSYYQNLVTDINRQLQQVAANKDNLDAIVLKNLDVPNITKYWQAYKADPSRMPASTIIEKIADWQNLQTQQRIDAARRSENKDNKNKLVEDQTERFTNQMANDTNLVLKDVTNLGGMRKVSDLVTFFNDAASGKIKVDDAVVDQRVGELNASIQTLYRQKWTQAHTPGPDGTTVAGTIGEEATDKIIQRSLLPLTTIRDFARSKEDGPAFFHARQNLAIGEDAKNGFLINKDVEKTNRQIIGARHVLGEQYFPEWIKNMIDNNVDIKYKGLFEQEAMSAITPFEDQRGTPVQRYYKDAIQHGKRVEAPPEFFGKATELVGKIADPGMPQPAKDRLIDWAFNPKNIGMLNELKMDYRDPNTGEMVPGKYRAFNIMGSPLVTQGIAENAKVKPQNYVKYQTTMEAEFTTLFRSDIATISKIIDKPYLGVHFGFDKDSNRLVLLKKDGLPYERNERLAYSSGETQSKAIYLNGAMDVVDRVNSGLATLANIQKSNPAGGGNTSMYLFNTLRRNDFNTQGMSSTSRDITKALIKSHNPKVTDDQLNNMVLKQRGPIAPPVQPMEFAPQEDRSVQGFIRNPTGSTQTPEPPLEPYQTRRVIRGNLSDQPIDAPVRTYQ